MSTPKQIIALSGYKQSGKDTVCSMLQEILAPARAVRFAFADALKLELAAACGVSVEEVEQQKSRYRMGLQWWGTEFRRRQNENYWLERLESKLNQTPFDFAIVTDCRYPNEAELIRRLGGAIVRVQRPGGSGPDGHSSEIAMDSEVPDFTVINSGNLHDLRFSITKTLPLKKWCNQ